MINGKTTSLRPIERDDLQFLKEVSDDPAVRGNVGGWDWPHSHAGQVSWFESSGSSTTQRWVVEDKQGARVGLTGLWEVDWHNRNAVTGLKLGGQADVRGRGLGPDAIKTVMAFAFYDVGLERLHSTILADNAASRRAYCDKSGWVVEGCSRRHVWRHGEFVDLLQVGALRSDFDALPDAAEYRDLITARSV